MNASRTTILGRDEREWLPSQLQGYVASDWEDGEISYYGFTTADEEWFIARFTSVGIRFVRGQADYETNWDNRDTLTYDFYFNEF